MHPSGVPEIWDTLVVALLELLDAEALGKSPPTRSLAHAKSYGPKSLLISFPAGSFTASPTAMYLPMKPHR